MRGSQPDAAAAGGVTCDPTARSEAAPRLKNAVRGSLEGEQLALAAAVLSADGTELAICGRHSAAGRALDQGDIFRIASLTKIMTGISAMMLVEDGVLTLDDPITDYLPELAARAVLRTVSSPLDDTVPAKRNITLRDLLTNRCGLGALMHWPPNEPIQKAMIERGLSPDFALFDGSAESFVARIAELPLAAQPGEAFLYHTGFELAGILIERASGTTLEGFMRERLFGPLDMADTAFSVAPEKLDRLTALYASAPSGEGLVPVTASWARFDRHPSFESGAAGLASTIEDMLRFAEFLLGAGVFQGKRLLSTACMNEVMTDQLTREQREAQPAIGILGQSSGWGLGGAVDYGGGPMGLAAGAYGWTGAYGTSLYVDRKAGLAGVLLTNRMMDSPEPPSVFSDFWSEAYRRQG